MSGFIKKLLKKSKKQKPNKGITTLNKEMGIGQHKEKEDRTIRIMLAGALGVGKTTLLKQTRYMYNTTAEIKDEIDIHIHYIKEQIVSYMNILCHQSKQMAEKQQCEETGKIYPRNQCLVSGFIRQYQHKLPKNIIPDTIILMCIKYFANNDFSTNILPQNEELRNAFLLNIKHFSEMNTTYELTIDIANKIKHLWSDPGIKQTFHLCHKFQFPDNVEYWFDKVMDIAADDYVPNVQDYIVIRTRSTGYWVDTVKTNEFCNNDMNFIFKFLDVGGAKSERKKWWDYCVHVHFDVVIYVVALNDYAKKIFENNITNRLHESLNLFKRFCNDERWSNMKCIVLFNKFDLFKQKIIQIPISECFDDFPMDKCAYNETDVFEFIVEKFQNCVKDSNKKLEFYRINALNSNQVEKIIKTIMETLVCNALKRVGI
eukprot:504315_1